MLQSYAWALTLGERCARPFSDELYERYWMAARLLYQVTDQQSGCAPNYGSNDGSVLFHLDSCDFDDYRPALALAFWVAERRRVFPPGPWDEPLLWLCGEQPLTKSVDPPERVQLAAKDGGYYTIRGDQTWAFTRCCTYRDRPAQADMLHLDVWWRGVNIVADPGTYSYNSAPPWNNGLASTGVHNSVQVDGLDQMERGPRFTWFYWTRGQVVRRDSFEEGRIKLFEAEHYGYRRKLGVVHRRAVLLVDDRLWVIVDDLYGKGEHELSSQWLFPGAEVEEHSDQMVILGGPAGRFTMSLFSFAAASPAASLRLELVKGEPNTTRGWWSPKYFYKEAALAVVIKQKCALPARWVTLLALGDGAVPCVITETSLSASVGTGQFEMVTAPVLGESVGSVVKEVRFGPERRGRTLP
jgi:asparagine synthase (glutamine-hydrolysing)